MIKAISYLFLLLAWVQCRAGESDGKLTMRVEPKISSETSSVVLEFHARYTGPRPVRAIKSSLLGERLLYTISFHGAQHPNYEAKPFIACPNPAETAIIDDPGFGEMEIFPGQEFVQKIDLRKIYGNIQQILGKCDFVFFWSYKLELSGDVAAPRMAGAIVIPASLAVEEPNSVTVNLLRKKRAGDP